MFVLEQASFHRDIDGRDFEARHLRAMIGGRLAAAVRLIPAGGDAAARIGRVVVARDVRRQGLGRLVVTEALAEHGRLAGGTAIDVSAQTHLRAFYAGFGFYASSEPYDEDGVEHVDMRRGAIA